MTPIVKTAIGLAVGFAVVVVALLAIPASQPTAPAAAVSGLNIAVNEELAQRGATVFNAKGCGGCHSVTSLGISGGSAGPDLSRILLGEVPSGTRPEAHPIARLYSEQGLTNPAADIEKAAHLLEEYLEEPPSYSPLMQGQVQRLQSAAGHEQWERDVKAMVELFKKAAAGR